MISDLLCFLLEEEYGKFAKVLEGIAVIKEDTMFKKGIYQFNREPNFNFQLNRVVMWGNGDPEEVLSVSENITDSRNWVDALTSLARKAEEEGRAGRRFTRAEYEVRSCVGETGKGSSGLF